MIISTGDELVEPGRPASFGLIRDSNAFTLFGGLREAGAEPFMGGIVRDDVEQLRETVLGLAIRADCFISSGGVSVGERDVVKKAFFRRGDIEFYKVAMQPGMPQGFGAIEGKPYWGLPGNPVSVFVSFEVFIRPALLKMMGRSDIFRPEVTAILETDVSGPTERMVFARVRCHAPGRRVARCLAPGRGSRTCISTVAKANGLAIIPQGVGTMPAGREGARDAVPRARGRGVSEPAPAGDAVARPANIVEVGDKDVTERVAVAECVLRTTSEAVAAPPGRAPQGKPARGRQGGRPHGREADLGPASLLSPHRADERLGRGRARRRRPGPSESRPP